MKNKLQHLKNLKKHCRNKKLLVKLCQLCEFFILKILKTKTANNEIVGLLSVTQIGIETYMFPTKQTIYLRGRREAMLGVLLGSQLQC